MNYRTVLTITALFGYLTSVSSATLAVAQERPAASPFVCNMSVMTPEERKAHQETGQKIFQSVRQVKELQNGYALRLSTDSSMLKTVAQFIEMERLCCPFMKFVVEVGEEHGPLWVRITGRKGTKEFIREEFDLDALGK